MTTIEKTAGSFRSFDIVLRKTFDPKWLDPEEKLKELDEATNYFSETILKNIDREGEETLEDLLAYKKAYDEIAKIVTDEYVRYHEKHYKEEEEEC